MGEVFTPLLTKQNPKPRPSFKCRGTRLFQEPRENHSCRKRGMLFITQNKTTAIKASDEFCTRWPQSTGDYFL